tara:strand:- start:331 stop:648 length:318 start_codon:yes stop_codon:yes gene_type:complete
MVKVIFGYTMWKVKRVAGVPLNKETITSLTQAVKDVAKSQYATPTLVNERLRICDNCPHGSNKCSLCGCFLKSKTALLNSQCPMHKWPSASEASVSTTQHENATE